MVGLCHWVQAAMARGPGKMESGRRVGWRFFSCCLLLFFPARMTTMWPGGRGEREASAERRTKIRLIMIGWLQDKAPGGRHQ